MWGIQEYSTPGKRDFFQVSETVVVLEEDARKFFHTIVAKLLYLLKNMCPEILTVISFLRTRVTRATGDDMMKSGT